MSALTVRSARETVSPTLRERGSTKAWQPPSAPSLARPHRFPHFPTRTPLMTRSIGFSTWRLRVLPERPVWCRSSAIAWETGSSGPCNNGMTRKFNAPLPTSVQTPPRREVCHRCIPPRLPLGCLLGSIAGADSGMVPRSLGGGSPSSARRKRPLRLLSPGHWPTCRTFSAAASKIQPVLCASTGVPGRHGVSRLVPRHGVLAQHQVCEHDDAGHEGRFDRVPRAKLVQVLADMGIPEWLVDITYSFLLGRVEFNVVTRNTVIGSREVCCLGGVVWKTEGS